MIRIGRSSRSVRSSLFSSPLVATTVVALALWGCGSSSNGGPGIDGGGHDGGGSGGHGGTAGSSAGGHGGTAGGTGGSTAGTSGGGTTGEGGSTAGTGGSTAGTDGSTAGTSGGSGGTQGGSSGTGTAGSTAGSGGTTGTAGSTGGSSAGTGGSGTAGTTGTAGASAGSGGSGTAGASAGTGGSGTAGSTAGTGGSGTAGASAGSGGSGATGGSTAGTGGSGTTCTSGAACALPNSVKGLCVGGACQACVASTDDAACATAYGSGNICVSGNCVQGNCHSAADCTGSNANKVCTNNSCTGCANDGECLSTSTGYGANHLCQGSVCVSGNCRSTNDSTNGPTCTTSGLICTSGTCMACNADTDCSDPSAYGPDHICLKDSNGQNGQCISGNCHATTGTAGCSNGQICDLATTHKCVACTVDADCSATANYGPGSYCQAGACTAGQCRVATDCSGANAGKLCNSSLQCYACASNADCTATSAYGANHVCVSGACVSGSCATSADCTGTNQICDTTSHACVACTADSQCLSDYGAVHICLKDSNGQNGQCVAGDCHDTSADCTSTKSICGGSGVAHTCGGCVSDAVCKGDTTYGSTTICLGPGASGQCVTGDCHDTSNDCTLGKICGVSTAHTCGSCSSGSTGDTQCTNDARYTGDICYQGNCGPGNCHATSADCTGANAGFICGVTTTNTCGACTSDTQCKSDATYGSATICNISTGKCVSNVCSTNSTTCSANSGDFCCGSACVAGNCCNDTDCVNNGSFGVGYACVGNNCSQCNPASGNTYYVDPVNGNDQTATGSGLSGSVATPSCSFKTITRAIQVIGNAAPPNTKVVLVGVSGTTRTLASGDTLPITLPTNVTLTTKTGPFKITLANTAIGNPAGFRLLNAGSGITSDAAGPLTLDGNNHASGIAIQVAAGSGNSVTLSNVTIQNTGGHSITVTSGTLNIGAGVVVSGAGVAGGANTRDGLFVSGGSANISVPAGQATTSFNTNTLYGIEVQTLGSVNITGVPANAPSSNGTVTANGNTNAGLRINQTVGGTGVLSTVNGLVAWANQNYGARLFGGSKVKVRNSVFGTNAIDGILVSNGNGTAAGNDLTNIDLGIANDPGLNWLQVPLGSLGTNLTAGLCVGMSPGMGALTLNARGNLFVTTGSVQVNCATGSGTITKAGTCQNHNSIGGSTAAAGTTVTIDVTSCN